MGGTLSFADIYGVGSASSPSPTPGGGSVGGPNPSSATATGMPTAGPMTGGAAFTWVGFALALVLLRVVIEAGGKVE